MAELFAACARRSLLPGEALFRQGDPAGSVFLIERGELRMVRHLLTAGPKHTPTLLFSLSTTTLLAMWRQPLRCMMLMLLGLAFLGGTTVQALPPSGASQTMRAASPMPSCTDVGMARADAPAPHKGITPDCVKLAKCLGIPFSPGPAAMASAPIAYATAAYWSSNPLPGGLFPIPLPFPPRSA